MQRPLIVISNDDGYQAKGINELVDMVRDLGDILVCAPSGAQSGKSRAFTLGRLTIDHLKADDNVDWWSCSGTPVDCVKIAYGKLAPRKPDLVIGGINHGDNASTNAHYSGTIGVVFEGCMKGIPSVAFSLCDYDADADFEPMRNLVHNICERILKEGLPHFTCLNVNVPKVNSESELAGVKVCRMADGYWRKEVVGMGVNENGKDEYELMGYYQSNEPDAEDTDAWALRNGFVAITPCTIDLTSYELAKKVQSWGL